MPKILSSFVFAAALTSVVAQNPVELGNAAGVAYPTLLVGPYFVADAPDAHVYASLFESAQQPLPTGRYLFDVVDLNFVSLSQLPVHDRVFLVTNNGGGNFTMQRESATPGLPGVGVGINGGDSMPLFPFTSPLPAVGLPECTQKVLMYQLDAQGVATYVGFRHFRVGFNLPANVSGVVFEDLDHDGVRDVGEPGVPGCTIKLVSNNPQTPGQVMQTTSTDAAGAYQFTVPSPDDCSVVLELNTQMYTATTPTDVRLSACGCGSQTVNFGKFTVQQQCVGRTPGFWRNNNGVAIIVAGEYWDELVALNLVTASGGAFDPTGNVQEWRSYMQGGSAVNMAYMLSIHLAAMQLNVLSGNVGENCWVSTSSGPTTIGALMTAANEALGLDGYTPVGDPNRAVQEALKNALDAANNNLNWL